MKPSPGLSSGVSRDTISLDCCGDWATLRSRQPRKYVTEHMKRPTKLSGSMRIEAPGYKPLTYNLSLKQMSELEDLYIDSLGPAPPTGLGAATDGAVTSHPAATRYVARIDAKRIAAAARH